MTEGSWSGSRASAPPPFLLAEKVTEQYPRRAFLIADGSIFIAPDGEAVGHATPPSSPRELLVISSDEGMTRILERGWKADLALYISEQALAEVVAVHTRLLASPQAASSEGRLLPGVDLAPGSVLKRVATVPRPVSAETSQRQVVRHSLVEVTYADADLEARGYVDAQAINRTFVPEAAPTAESVEVNAALLGCSELFAGPDGSAFVRLGSGATNAGIIDLGQRDKDMVLIRYSGAQAIAVGWVPARCVGPEPHYLVGRGRGEMRGRWAGIPREPTTTLRHGTPLYDRPAGNIVGVVREDAEFHQFGESESGWIKVGVLTQFGEVPVWIRATAP